jgi:hypothetical protein
MSHTYFSTPWLTWTWRDGLTAAFATWLAYYVALCIYRVYFHPLAKFPGPKVTYTLSRPSGNCNITITIKSTRP